MAVDRVSSSSREDEPSELPVAIGDVLDGKYRIVRVLGKGGMGVVMAAMHVQLGHRVALKFLSRSGARNEETLARFALEAKAAALMRSDHATRILDIGRLPRGEPYMVLEMLEGSDLGALVARCGPLPTVDAVSYVLEACEAIAEAHALGIVHRDLKPDNLFLATRPDGTQIVKVLDFGISKFSSPTDEHLGPMPALTTTTAIIGSPIYMSPEQLRSTRNVDHRTDIWSMGVVLYELLSGQPPFSWRSMAELSAAILKDEPVPLGTRLPEIPAELDRVILRCLQKNPHDRFDNIAELAWALAPFGHPRATSSAERASELLARAPLLQKNDVPDELAKRRAEETQDAEPSTGAPKIVAVPAGASCPAKETATTKEVQGWSLASSTARRGLPAIVTFTCLLLTLSSNRYLHPRLIFSKNRVEAHRGIANVASKAAIAIVFPKPVNQSPSTNSTPESPQPSTVTSVRPATSSPSPVPRGTPSANVAPGSARVSRRNPFADRE